MIPVILQVHVDRGQWVDVPVTPDTTCRDVIECCREPGDEPCRLIQTMGFKEEAIPLDFRMMDVLGRHGENWALVSFHLQYGDPMLFQHTRSRQLSPTELVERKKWSRKLPEGGNMSLSELRQMAARQQHQIEAHQQLLVAKEQRLKFLKQQEVRHQQQQGISVDADRLRHLREKVELQELKLRRLRALRGQVEQHRSNNTNLSAELESIRALFNEKEKELSVAVAKVEELTRQLEDVRRGDMKGMRQGSTPSPAALEFQKLRRELLYRSKLNEQQNARIAQQRETLAKRQSEISQMDQRIAELQQRLQRKRLLNQQLSSQLHSASRTRPRANIAAVEPLKRTAQEIELIQDDLKVSGEQPSEFTPNKKDPKYQTLPYNTKFSGLNSHENSHNKGSPIVMNGELEKHILPNSGPPPYPEPPNRFQSHHKPSPPQGLGNLSPRPFGSTYSTSILNSDMKRGQHLSHSRFPASTSNSSAVNSSNSPTVSNSKTVTTTATTPAGPHRTKPHPGSYSSHQVVLPPTVMTTSQVNTNRTVPQTPVRQHPSPGFGSFHQRVNDTSTKPAVPPKPGNSSKPVPPPRQIHGVGTLLSNIPKPDTVDQALSVLKGSNRSLEDYRANSKFTTRSPQERIQPPYHHTQQKPDVHSDANKENNSQNSLGNDNNLLQNHPCEKSNSSTRLAEAGTVHISLNRRIGMPPAFYFPENQTPPSDLSSSETADRLLLKHTPEDQYVDKIIHESSLHATSNELNSENLVNNSKESSVSDDFNASSSSDPPSDSGVVLGSSSSNSSATDSTDRTLSSDQDSSSEKPVGAVLRRVKKGNLKTKGAVKSFRRVSFDPLALLLDAALEGELELVKKTAKEVPNPSAANDEGITALHNAICAGHFEIVKFLVEHCCDVNAQDSDGWTPLHCAASCNNLAMVKYLVERGACIFATTLSDHETAAEKCEEDEEGFDGCSEYLYSMQEKLGILNGGTVYALYDYEGQNSDELSFRDGDQLVVLRKGDDLEREWWWSKQNDREGYIPRNLLGLHPRVTTKREQQ